MNGEKPEEGLPAKVIALRDGGASWKEIGEKFGLSRQRARYEYQLAKRAQRRTRPEAT